MIGHISGEFHTIIFYRLFILILSHMQIFSSILFKHLLHASTLSLSYRTIQQERRPPRQGLWLIHECIFVENAFALTEV